MTPEYTYLADPFRIPAELRERVQWVNWTVENREGRETKPPKNPDGSGAYARSNDSATWDMFQTALATAKAKGDWGVGMVLTENDPYTGFDVDAPLTDCAEGELPDWLPAFNRLGNAYIDVSPSGSGFRIVLKDVTVPEWWTDQSEDTAAGTREVAVIPTGKYLTFTGDVVEGYDSIGTVDDDALSEWLADVYAAFNDGTRPDTTPSTEPTSRASDDGAVTADPGTKPDPGIAISDVLGTGAYSKAERTSHPFHGSSTGSNFKVDDGDETWRCWRHDCTGNALHLVGIEQGIICCGDWVPGGLDTDTWSEIFNAARAAGYDVSDQRSDRNGHPDCQDGWDYVRALFDSSDKGSSTSAYNAAADILLRNESLVCVRETGEFYRYDPGCGYYRRKGKSYIREQLQTAIPQYVNNTRARNIIERVRDRSFLDQEEFTPPEGKVVVENCVLDLDTREVEPSSPDYYFTAGLGCEYDPSATADEWIDMLRETVPHDGARATLQEFAGYCLEVWHHKRAKNLFVVGPTASGKSTFVGTFAAVFGSVPAVSRLTPQQLADTQFDQSALIEAVLNARNDINSTKIEDSGTLKTIFAGEHIKAERKYQDATFVAPTAKHLFSANWVPRVVGEDEAFYRRLLLVEFPQTIPREDRDLDLPTHLREHELSGILNWALDGRDRLREQEGFTRDRDPRDTRLAWLSWRSAPLRFLFTHCEITGDSDDCIERKSAYRAYKEWAATNGYDIRPQQSLTNYWKQVPHVEVTSADSGDVFSGVQFATGGTDTGDGSGRDE